MIWSRRALRSVPLFLILVMAAALAPTSLAAPYISSSSSSAVSNSASSPECFDTAANARAFAGRDGTDPNDLSVADSLKAEQKLDAGLQRVGIARTSRVYLPLVTVDVHVHVITRDDGSGGVTRQQISDQIAVLNAGFAGRTAGGSAPTAFRFVVKSIDNTRNTDWYNWSLDDDTDDAEAKSALHKGGFDDLNLYITGLQLYLGYSEFPYETTLVEDGVVVLNESLPGGSAAPYNEGDTLTHEVGHWLGLYHTFENGCLRPGDHVADTPYQFDGDNIFFCRESDDTCPAPGRDPVHNFMGYGDDPCMNRFTPGQALRMGLVWLAFRR